MSTAVVKSRGTHSLLAAYLAQLATHPLRTKAITVGTLCFLQEVLASHLAGVPMRKPLWIDPWYKHLLLRAKVDSKAFKMAIYGFLVSAPLGHFLVGWLQKAFVGRTGTSAKVAQIIASNLLIAPVQATVYLASMAVINGAKSLDEIKKTVRGGFMTVLRVSWVSSPLSMAFAQNFLPPDLWVPFFNLVSFSIGTYFNTRVKSLKLAAERKKAAEEGKGKAKDQ
ncbi:hypothetical protein K488DRAFT_40712 [Vararia minispora EC-137]|uniref:Uncharacterized protein n=1 Tax=Vararia minispora EC-137 TaxID=1314806 RepID=A0ACB8QYK9_9AGAM|nr:hypothetical protein K488DRAFT_40712 [Vararia minispora EC-137]